MVLAKKKEAEHAEFKVSRTRPFFFSLTSQSVVVWVSIVHDFLGNSMPFSMHASSTFSEKRTLQGRPGKEVTCQNVYGLVQRIPALRSLCAHQALTVSAANDCFGAI